MVFVYIFFNFILAVSFLIPSFISPAAANDVVLKFCPQYQSLVKKADVIGVARDIKSGDFLYCEYHMYQKKENPNNLTKKTFVEYRALDQALIATKSVDYSPGLVRPNVIQKDLRHNELRSTIIGTINSNSVGDDDNKSTANVSYRKPNSEEVKSIAIDLTDMLVIDAGFDEAVKQYWFTLIRGEKLIIDFLSPVHLRTLRLTVKQSNTDSCYKETYDRENQACFLIRPSNMVLNLFVKPLALIYDLTTKRLILFKGDVNITDTQGGTLNAVIQYYYDS